MRYQVPQFIEVEDKIFGPFTLRQFIYLAGGAALSYILYVSTISFLPFFLVLILMVPVLVLGVTLAFYKPNGKPFLNMVESAIKYYIGSKLYLWKKEVKKVTRTEEAAQNQVVVPKLADSKLKDLAWNLNISGPMNKQN